MKKKMMIAAIGAGALLLAACGSSDAAEPEQSVELSWADIYKDHGEITEDCNNTASVSVCLSMRRQQVDTLATTLDDAPRGKSRSDLVNSIDKYIATNDKYDVQDCAYGGTALDCGMLPVYLDADASVINLQLKNAAGVGPKS